MVPPTATTMKVKRRMTDSGRECKATNDRNNGESGGVKATPSKVNNLNGTAGSADKEAVRRHKQHAQNPVVMNVHLARQVARLGCLLRMVGTRQRAVNGWR